MLIITTRKKNTPPAAEAPAMIFVSEDIYTVINFTYNNKIRLMYLSRVIEHFQPYKADTSYR